MHVYLQHEYAMKVQGRSSKRTKRITKILQIGPVVERARRQLKRQENNSAGYESDRNAAAAIDSLVQKEFRSDHITHESERSGGGRDQADVAPGQSE
jgi:hypothetical protein